MSNSSAVAATSPATHTSSCLPKTTLPLVGYFSMEMAIDQSLHIYSGGLGFLAGSHMLSAGQLGLPMVGVTMLWRKGYGEQQIDPKTHTVSITYTDRDYSFLQDPGITVEVSIFGQSVYVKAFLLKPETFNTVPVYLLTTHIPQNSPGVQAYCDKLYDSDERVRIAQKIILGIAGLRVLEKAGITLDLIHLNEGHGLPAAFEQLSKDGFDAEKTRQKVVFTTHTPVAAGNETHNIHLLAEAGFFAGTSVEQAAHLGGGDEFSLTVGALRLSRRSNGVSQLHGQVANRMWNWVDGGCPIVAITNAVNPRYWQDKRIALASTATDLLAAKKAMRQELVQFVQDKHPGKQFSADTLTIVWARRFTEYKRATLIFKDRPRIQALLDSGKLQLIFAGKFHPKDDTGRQQLNEILSIAKDQPRVAVLTDYELALSGLLKRGSDIWLNTPLRPLEASGTSGMAANMNGALHVTTFDGWSVEGTYHGQNGFIINEADADEADYIPLEQRHQNDYNSMMDILENMVIPLFYQQPDVWAGLMQRAIHTALAYFSSDRMAIEYYTRLYKPALL